MERVPEPRFQLYGQERFHTGILSSWAIMDQANETHSPFCDFLNRLVNEPDFFGVADRLEPLMEYKKVDLCLISPAQRGNKGVAIELKVDSTDSMGMTGRYFDSMKDHVSHFVYLTLGDGEFAVGPYPSFRWVGLEEFMRSLSLSMPRTEPPLKTLLQYWYGALEQELQRRRTAINVLLSGEDEQLQGYRNGGTKILALREIEEKVSPRLPSWNSSVYRHGPAPDTILNFQYRMDKPFYAEINSPGYLSLKVNNEKLEAVRLRMDQLIALVKTCSGNPKLVKQRQGKSVQVARWDLGLWASVKDMDTLTARIIAILEDVEDKLAARV